MDRRVNIGFLYLIFGLAGLSITLFGLLWDNFGAPLWKALRVPDRMGRLTPGMTRAQVMATLGLTGCRIGPGMEAGSLSATWESYQLRPGVVMLLTFDNERNPGTFVSGQVDGTDWHGLVGAGVWVLVTGLGALQCLRFRRLILSERKLALEHESAA